nr:Mut7-C RNAse domain-containing protein [Actinacidiphila yeochonensis]
MSHATRQRPLITVHVPAELRIFLSAGRRAPVVETAVDGVSTLGHLVEALGIPLTEVGGLRVDGADAPRKHLPAAGADVEVLPVPRPQRVPGAPLRFLLDVHLGTLARRLRLLGIDAAYENEDIGDPALAARSAAERRVLLSRDRGLLRRRELWCGGYVYSDRPDVQLADVLERFAPELAPWTRCVACNGQLVPADKASVRDSLQQGTRATYDVFAQCAACDRVYWKGAHHADLEAVVEWAMDAYGSQGAARG